MHDERFDRWVMALAGSVSRRDLLRGLLGTAGTASLLSFPRLGRAAGLPPGAAQSDLDPKFVRPPLPGAYCWNTAGKVNGPAQAPTPFMRQPFAAGPANATDFSVVWTAQVDHSRPTYEQDRVLATLGERLAASDHRDENDPRGPLQGGTRVYLGGTYRQFDHTVSIAEIRRQTGSTIYGYESPSIEDYLFYDGHDGHDFAVTGSALAAAEGEIAFLGTYNNALGRVVEVYHEEGYLTRYAHLAGFAEGLEVGTPIRVGEPVGAIGGSRVVGGELVDAPDERAWRIHLHFSVYRWDTTRRQWQITDPFGWDPYLSPGEQGDDPLVACNGEVSYNLWFGWWPRPADVPAGGEVQAARPAGGRYLGGSLTDTGAQATPAPTFTKAPAVGSIAATTAVVTWTTDQAVSGVVEYGETTAYGLTAATPPGESSTSGRVELTSLEPGRTYHLRVRVAGDGGETVSDDLTFTTAAASHKLLVAYTQDYNIWLMNDDGSRKRALTTKGSEPVYGETAAYPWFDYQTYFWSRDGTRLYFTEMEQANSSTSTWSFFVHDPTSGKTEPLATGLFEKPSLSPDERYLLYAQPLTVDVYPRTYDLFALDLITGAADRVIAGAVSGGTWAVDSDEFLYASANVPSQSQGVPLLIERASLDGSTSSVPGYTAGGCDAFWESEPAADLWDMDTHHRFNSMTPIQWTTGEEVAIYNNVCGSVLADFRSQSTERLDGQGLMSPSATKVAVVGYPDVLSVSPVRSMQDSVALGTGRLPVWTSDGTMLYVMRQELREEHKLIRADNTGAQIMIRDNTSTLWRVNVDGSGATKLVERDVYGFGWVSPDPDGRFLVFSEVENATKLWQNRLPGDLYDEALLARYQPQIRILRLDLVTGKLKTVVRNAGRPKVQPVAVAAATASGSTPLAIVQEPGVSDLTPTSATVTWTTDREANSTVEYGEAGNFDRRASDPALVREHRIALSGLQPETDFSYRVTSAAGGREVTGPGGTFRTPGKVAATLGVAMLGVDAARGGRMPGPGPRGEPVVRWRAPAYYRGKGSAVVDNGVVYIGGRGGLTAFDAVDGTVLWQADTDGELWSSPAVVDGRVFANGEVFLRNGCETEGSLVAFEAASGRELWRYRTNGGRSSPAVQAGVVYVTSNDNALHAVDAKTGQARWVVPVAGGCTGASPAVAHGLVFVGAGTDLLTFDAVSGGERWRFEAVPAVGSPMVAGSTLYVGSAAQGGDAGSSGALYALDARKGTLVWSASIPVAIDALPVRVDDWLYVGGTDGALHALDAGNGAVRWSFQTGSSLDSTAAIVDGIAYVVSGSRLFAVDAASGERRWDFAFDNNAWSAPVVVGGTVFAAELGLDLYAIGGSDD